MRSLKEIMPIFVRDNLLEIQGQERDLIEDLMARSRDMSLSDIEKEIAEIKFGKPVHLIGDIGIRPFWRDGREAPPLPVSKEPIRRDPYRSHHF